jgi:TatA/E family protein of Tat protein translocase
MLGSPIDIALVAGVALLLFGPKKLPEIGRAIGQSLGNFKKALTEAQTEVKEATTVEEKPSAQTKSSLIEEEKNKSG